LYRNIFLGGAQIYTVQSACGTEGYEGSTTSLEEYIDEVLAKGVGDLEMYVLVKQPVYIDNNCYLNGAKPFEREKECVVSDANPGVRIVEEADGTYLELTAGAEMLKKIEGELGSSDLGMVRIVEAAYETPEGKEIFFDSDYLGKMWNGETLAGPFAELKEGQNRIKVWPKE
ncbi:MAG: hypothetical protein K2P30_07200, partial [Lachnospiraceae bacterium]|nr:hypothetical protein [Lachnospiraceae bacterium]